MTNTDRFLAYLVRSAPYRVADPDDWNTRIRRGLRLQALPFPWGQAARGKVLTLRRRA